MTRFYTCILIVVEGYTTLLAQETSKTVSWLTIWVAGSTNLVLLVCVMVISIKARTVEYFFEILLFLLGIIAETILCITELERKAKTSVVANSQNVATLQVNYSEEELTEYPSSSSSRVPPKESCCGFFCFLNWATLITYCCYVILLTLVIIVALGVAKDECWQDLSKCQQPNNTLVSFSFPLASPLLFWYFFFIIYECNKIFLCLLKSNIDVA